MSKFKIDYRTFEVGCKVEGGYHGTPFTGTLVNIVPDTQSNASRYHIQFDTPISVYGSIREECSFIFENKVLDTAFINPMDSFRAV